MRKYLVITENSVYEVTPARRSVGGVMVTGGTSIKLLVAGYDTARIVEYDNGWHSGFVLELHGPWSCNGSSNPRSLRTSTILAIVEDNGYGQMRTLKPSEWDVVEQHNARRSTTAG